KRSASAGTPVVQSPAKEDKGAAGADHVSSILPRSDHRAFPSYRTSIISAEDGRKKGTVRSANKSGSVSKSAEKKTGGVAPELSKKMTNSSEDKWCYTECEMWTPCTVKKVAPRRKFVIPACRLFKAETKADDVPIVPSGTILGELHERTRRYNNKTSVKVKSKKKMRKYKSSTEDKFTTKKD
ncbi:hypothetical protein PMAYCL1PPCAC_14505, partial [Pristionchus mayeri]